MARLTEKIDIEVETFDGCQNPVYLRWLNNMGGYNFWLFNNNNTKQHKIGNELNQGVFRDSFSTSESLVEKIRQTAGTSIFIMEDKLTYEHAMLITTMFESVHVDQLFNPFNWENGQFWQRVIIDSGNVEIGDRKANLFSLEFNINYQPRNIPWA